MTRERYTILSPLGSGGFGSVYKAKDTMLHRDVALKRLDKGTEGDALREQLLREARVLASMQHPNIVSIYDITSHDEYDEIVMELLQGVSLDALVSRHLLQPSDFKNVACQILQALSASHNAGVLHCDVKPENIMLCMSSDDHYEAKVYDFGMSLPVEEQESVGKGKLMGSIYVMAPELFSGEQPSEQSDLYALGCVLYFLLTGAYPFQGDNAVQIMASHIKGEYMLLHEVRQDLPEELSQWLSSLLKPNKKQRSTSSKAVLLELRDIELSNKDPEFTLSTSLKLEQNNSRVVRSISVESLTQTSEKSSGGNTTIFLSNNFSYSAPVGVKPSYPEQDRKIAANIGELAEALELPKDAEWYFTIVDKVKGPVSLAQLTKLCVDGKVIEETLIWHALLGDWVTASNCVETKVGFQEKRRLAREAQARLEAEAVLREERILEEVQELKRASYAWFGSEVLIVFLAGIIALVFGLIYPEIWHYALAAYMFVLFFVGFVGGRLYQMRSSMKWLSFGLLVPFLSDALYAISRPSTRSTLCTLMVFAGGIGLCMMGYGAHIQTDTYKQMVFNSVEQPQLKVAIQEVAVPRIQKPTVPVIVEPAVEKAVKETRVQKAPTTLRALSSEPIGIKSLKDL
ncbi:protein kinase domain-containing protein [Rubritalea sp.]|uniref:protein kinase domain-containing protein n=1 Tax=Rubritalea sp. TaxID=2109375 RepID=UPI003EF0BF33